VAGVKLWIHDEDNDKWLPALGNDEGVLRVEMSGTYSPDIVIITDGAGHYLELPELTEAERDALDAGNGMMIYNSDTDTVDVCLGGVWFPFAIHPHAATHENGGADEISVAGLSGLLADDQHVLDAEVRAVSIENVVEDLTPQLGGNLDLNEKSIQYELTLDADGKYEGEYVSGVLGETVIFSEVVYLKTADQRWWKALADAEATSGDVMLGIMLEGGDAGETKKIMLRGFIREDDFNFISYGQALFIDASTGGDMTATAPAVATNIVRIVGYAGADANVVRFEPDKTWLEIA